MGTRKGDVRKTARRAYSRRRNTHGKARTVINLGEIGALLYAGDAVYNGDTGWGYTPGDVLKADGYNPLSGANYGTTGTQALVNSLKANKKQVAIGVGGAIVLGWVGRNTSIGRKMGLKTKKYEVRLF